MKRKEIGLTVIGLAMAIGIYLLFVCPLIKQSYFVDTSVNVHRRYSIAGFALQHVLVHHSFGEDVIIVGTRSFCGPSGDRPYHLDDDEHNRLLFATSDDSGQNNVLHLFDKAECKYYEVRVAPQFAALVVGFAITAAEHGQMRIAPEGKLTYRIALVFEPGSGYPDVCARVNFETGAQEVCVPGG